MIRKSLIVMLITTFATSLGASAQSLNVAQQGNKAVLFNFSGLSNLGLNEYNGGIGGKYFISDGLAVRGMLLFAINNSTTNSTPQVSSNSLAFGLQGGLEYHLPLASMISPYVGGVVSFQTSALTRDPGGIKTGTTAFGLGAIGGVEYFFNNNLSLSGEYQFGFTSTNDTANGSAAGNSLQLGFQTAGLTLAVYF